MNIKKLTVVSITLLSSLALSAQTISSTIIDKKTNEPIPYATIQLSEHKGIITNEEGKFSITLDEQLKQIDSIYISSMGYQKVGIALNTITDSIIYIEPKAIELSGVFISNKNLSIDEIIDNVKENVGQNYSKDLSHKKLFYRQSDFSDLNKMNIKFKKSTIKEFNKKFIDSVISIIPRKSAYYTEALCDLYGNFDKQKLNIIKGAELYDKSNDGSMEALSEKLEDILKKNVKPNSYLKIKSGWILGTKVQMDSIFDANEEAAEVKNEVEKPNKNQENYFLNYRKSSLKNLLSSMFFQEDSKLNFIDKSGRYKFELIDYTTIDDSSVYIINFEPKRGADFKGTIYVNTQDFAVMRVDYENVKNLKNFGLLGISFHDTMYKGKTIFTKGADGKYSVRYIEKTRGNVFGIDRPLKIIEKNKFVKGKRKQNELSLGLDIGAGEISKYEVVVFDSQPITESEYESSKENKSIKPQYLSKYDPEFWKGYNIIEPNTAIKQFTAIEGES
ncbi:carboxypeptidase-like regulatory domain-containing protein [Aquimarina sp. AD1]|uniref:carboxypeptidase-like regulatory domain-containing protein n=1 Tax=Aquimarina sp. (strain AD1) TaxID=1714848 RepID=UPI000E4B833E|nr:carboxypeptidase-like regulatory domain-containing protein [Aquimarina sp. AD1]AXT57435.1 carboxypeptidase-like regulatory domain-containing protein [Aquimarina sp. AD1]RKN06208.1 carboxypeptidase-like regulatory domain-containing protein [Aquimarina sp. AD1]